jgi:uncharacterized protein (DUF736 family)
MNNENQTTKTSREQETGAFWIKKSKAGNTFLSGYFLDANKEKVSVVVFKNNFKKPGEPSPDYRVYLSENNKTQQTQSAPAPQDVATDEGSSDEVPF